MHTHNNRAGRFSARLGLESLEGRTLLSATLPTPVAAVAQQATSSFEVHHLEASHHSVAPQPHAPVSFSYNWHVGPSAVITGTNSTTGNGLSTGSVDFALVRRGADTARLGGMPTAVPLGFVVTTSSASDDHPDRFNTSIVLKLELRDAHSGRTETVTFKGTITGTLSWTHSSLSVTFENPSQRFSLGDHVYTVTLPRHVHPTGPNDTPSALYAFVQVGDRH